MAHAEQNNLGIPIAIVAAGALVAGALFFSGGAAGGTPRSGNAVAANQVPGDDFRLPDDTDHVRGNPEAGITVIEFSDFECPFCAQLHPTLQRIVEESDDVRWVYRHFPLSSIHSRALGAAAASECIARLGGNDAFWTFADGIFANQRRLVDTFYSEQAKGAGIDANAFSACLADRSVADDIQADGDEAIRSGGRGTPFAVIVGARGRLTSFSGALPYEQVKSVLDQARTQ